MIKTFLFFYLLVSVQADTILEKGTYSLTNKDRFFEFNGIRDKYFIFKIKENFIYNKDFDSYYRLEENGELSLFKYYDKDTLVTSNKKEIWLIKNDNYNKSYYNKNNCKLLTNNIYELTFCKED